MKRLLSAILALAMVLSMTVVTATVHVHAETEAEPEQSTTVDVWDGEKVDTEFEGKGTPDDPWLIGTAAELVGFAQQLNAKKYLDETGVGVTKCGVDDKNNSYLHVKLIADIDLDGNEWTPIGLSASDCAFTGTFDGNGHTIKNFVINNSTLAMTGFFNLVRSAEIKDLTLDAAKINISITTATMAGAFVGAVAGGGSTLVLRNLHATKNVEIVQEASTKSVRVGGILGGVNANADKAFIYNCVNEASITVNAPGSANDSGVGGIAGCVRGVNTVIENCINTGDLNGSLKTTNRNGTGGIVGLVIDAAGVSIKNVINTGNVAGAHSAGGIVGYLSASNKANTYTFPIENAFSTASTVSATERRGIFAGGRYRDSQSCTFNDCVALAIDGLTDESYENYATLTNVTTKPTAAEIEALDAYKAILNPPTSPLTQGKGTEADPYIITTVEQFEYIRDQVNRYERFRGVYFALGNDIDFSTESGLLDWTPIGNTSENAANVASLFAGNLDGRGYTISGFNVVGTGLVGFFSSVAHGTIKNIKIAKATATADGSNGNLGILIARATDCVLANIEVEDTVTLTYPKDATQYPSVGGVAGIFYDANGGPSTIENIICNATINIEADDTVKSNGLVGGVICGLAGTMKNCVFGGTINYKGAGTATTVCAIGGLVGALGVGSTPGELSNSINLGKINAPTDKTFAVSGIVGRSNLDGSTVENCFNNSTEITGKYVGNVAAYATKNATIKNVVSVDLGESVSLIGTVKASEEAEAPATPPTITPAEEFTKADKATIESDETYKAIITTVTQALCNHENTTTSGAKDETCTEPGATGSTVCDDCGKVLAESEIIPAPGHKDEGEDGKCDVCGEDTCDHSTTTLKGNEDASCTEPGYTGNDVCDDCGFVVKYGEEIPATGHTEETVPSKDATCSETGLTEGTKCSVCGETLVEQEEIPVTDHTYINKILDGNANRVEDTEYEYYQVCSGCDAILETSTFLSDAFFASGDGTEATPFEIKTAEQLKLFAQLINSATTNAEYKSLYYKLGADIDLDGAEWTPVGVIGDTPFGGSFDGCGHTVSDFNVMTGSYVGFFGVAYGTITNLTVDDATFRVSGERVISAAIIVAHALSSKPINIENCVAGKGSSVTINPSSGATRIGGILGQCGNANTVMNVSNCVNYASVTLVNNGAKDSNVAGIVGFVRNGSIINCVNFGDVSVTDSTVQTYGGGIVGTILTTTGAKVENCINYGSVTGSIYRGGGIAGTVHDTSTATAEFINVFSLAKAVSTTRENQKVGVLFGAIAYYANFDNVKGLAIGTLATFGAADTQGDKNVSALELLTTEAAFEEIEAYNTILETLGLEAPGHNCADADKNHKCDICDATLSQCADADKNHKCDICDATLSECADAEKDGNHNCDVCDKPIEGAECSDATKSENEEDNDHNCDECGKENVSKHRYSSVVTTPATCTVDGYVTIGCGECGGSWDSRYDDEAKQYLIDNPYFQLAAKGHTEEALERKDPTYTESGLTEGKKCSVCDDILEAQKELPAINTIINIGISDRSYCVAPIIDGNTITFKATGKILWASSETVPGGNWVGFKITVLEGADGSTVKYTTPSGNTYVVKDVKDDVAEGENVCVSVYKNAANIEGTTTYFVDYNGDGENDLTVVIDVTGATLECETCTDADKDHNCDTCGEKISNCVDTEVVDGKCDICGEEVDHNCVDGDDANHTCDICQGAVAGEECFDAENDGDHNCDECQNAIVGAECADTNKDHKCDECGEKASDHKYGTLVVVPGCEENGYITVTCSICEETFDSRYDQEALDYLQTPAGQFIDLAPQGHKDDDSDHKCDRENCGETLSQCADENSDHNCDVCGKPMSECADENKDHKCDVCDETLTYCADTNPVDGKCDVCDNDVAHDCTDTDPADHKCDICGGKTSDCADGDDANHTCDICQGAVAGEECSDAEGDKDHLCDECGNAIADAECSDAEKDGDHLCDECGNAIADAKCSDASKDGDHECDECGKTVSEHAYGRLEVYSFCEETGYIIIGCNECGGIYDSRTDKEAQDYLAAHQDGPIKIDVSPKGHQDVVEQGYKAPTCTEPGKQADMFCNDCKKVITPGAEIPETGHSYESVVTAPTYTEKGYTTYTCVCGDSYKADEKPALNTFIDIKDDTFQANVSAENGKVTIKVVGTVKWGEVNGVGNNWISFVITAPEGTDPANVTITYPNGDSVKLSDVLDAGSTNSATIFHALKSEAPALFSLVSPVTGDTAEYGVDYDSDGTNDLTVAIDASNATLKDESGEGLRKEDHDVTGEFVGTDVATVYSVDITWGSLEFTYTEASKGVWNPETLKYEGAVAGGWTCATNADKITVTNHSNAAVSVTVEITSASTDVTLSVVEGATFELASADNATVAGTAGTATSKTVTVKPEGAITTNGKIGTIKVIIAAAE